ncbi:MAG: NAD(P)-dependent oxidoreductase [Spirochaetota bacterium]
MIKSGRTVLITGVNGYIGSTLAGQLKKKYSVIGIDRQENANAELAGITYHKADITDRSSIPTAVEKASILIHCAALVHNRSKDLSRENYFRVNVTGTENILSCVKRSLRRIIFLSTISVYGTQNGALDEGAPLIPEEPYAESKIAAENAILTFSKKHAVPATIFRLAPVYGADFLLNLSKRIYLPGKRAFYRIGSGEQRVSLCSVHNAVDIIIRGIEDRKFNGRTFNCADASAYSINDIIRAFQKRYHTRRMPILTIPPALPLALLHIFGIVVPAKAKFYRRQLMKIADDALYDTGALAKTRAVRQWDITRTLANTPGKDG